MTIVATHSLLAGLVLSATEAEGWNDWGQLMAVVPIIAWALANWLSHR